MNRRHFLGTLGAFAAGQFRSMKVSPRAYLIPCFELRMPPGRSHSNPVVMEFVNGSKIIGVPTDDGPIKGYHLGEFYE